MQVIELDQKNRSKYDEFVEKHPLGSINQTYNFGLFKSKISGIEQFKIILLIDEKNNIHGSALLLFYTLPFGKKWLYCPRGPLIDYQNHKEVDLIFSKIKEIANKNNGVFFRFDPPLINMGQETGEIFSHKLRSQSMDHVSGDFREGVHVSPSEKAKPYVKIFPLFPGKSIIAHSQYYPENTLILDLAKSQEDLLKEMKPKGRYNIKVAEKHKVKIRISTQEKDLKTFYEILKQTSVRDNFSAHPFSYYQEMLNTLDSKNAKLYLAEYNGKIIAGTIVTFFANTATYYFGASSNEYRNLMTPYLLQWQAILDAKAQGYKYYDFLGIAPENKSKHSLAKVTDFKLKFGGKQIEYLPAQEIIYQKFWYYLIIITKRLHTLF